MLCFWPILKSLVFQSLQDYGQKWPTFNLPSILDFITIRHRLHCGLLIFYFNPPLNAQFFLESENHGITEPSQKMAKLQFSSKPSILFRPHFETRLSNRKMMMRPPHLFQPAHQFRLQKMWLPLIVAEIISYFEGSLTAQFLKSLINTAFVRRPKLQNLQFALNFGSGGSSGRGPKMLSTIMRPLKFFISTPS